MICTASISVYDIGLRPVFRWPFLLYFMRPKCRANPSSLVAMLLTMWFSEMPSYWSDSCNRDVLLFTFACTARDKLLIQLLIADMFSPFVSEYCCLACKLRRSGFSVVVNNSNKTVESEMSAGKFFWMN